MEKLRNDNAVLKMLIKSTFALCVLLIIITGIMCGDSIQNNKKVDRMEAKHIELLKKMGIFDPDEYYNIMR